jgi:hypothetical protein
VDHQEVEWEQAGYWQQHTDVLSESGLDEARTRGAGTGQAGAEDDLGVLLPDRPPGRARVRILFCAVAVAVAVTAVVAVVRPARRSAPPSSAERPTTALNVETPEPLPGSSTADTAAGAVPSLTPPPEPAELSPTPPATTSAGKTTGAPRTTAATKAGGATPAAVPVTAPAAGMVVRVVSRASGDSIGVAQGSTVDGAPIVASSNIAATAQQWRLVAADEGCFGLVNVHSGLALDDPDGSTDDGVQMQQWTTVSGDVNQAWCFRPVGAGLFSIRNLAAGTLLDLRDGGRDDGTAIQQWGADPAAPNANQTWLLLRVR